MGTREQAHSAHESPSAGNRPHGAEQAYSTPDEAEWAATLDAASALDLEPVSRQALEQLARAALRWDAGPGFPGGSLADALERIKAEVGPRKSLERAP